MPGPATEMATPHVTGVLETSLYVADLERSREFYARLFAFETFLHDGRLCAMGVPGHHVLLLFRHGGSVRPSPTPGGTVPAHDGTGRLHLCFAIRTDELAAWETHLARHGVAMESRVTWPHGGTSLYFRDPDEHSLEVATPGLWPNY